jgi:hypothetical protein
VLRGSVGQGSLSIKLFYAMNITGGSTTITLSSSPIDVGIHAVEYSGVATGTALDVTNTAVANGNTTTTPTSGSFTPAVGDLVYAYFGDEATGQTSITAGTGYTIISATGNHADASENNLAAASGPQTTSFTVGTATQTWALYVAAFKASGSGGSTLLCGTADDGLVHVPPNYSCSSPPCTTNPFPPPAKGASYVDPQYGCSVQRLTDAVGDHLTASAHHQYSTITPINSNDTYVMILLNDGNLEIVDTSGGVIVPAGTLQANTADLPWDISVPTRFYYANGTAIIQGDIQGLPTCAATHNCTVQSTTIKDFSGTYSSIQIPDQEDISDDGDHLWLVGDTSTTHKAFLFTISTNSRDGSVA